MLRKSCLLIMVAAIIWIGLFEGINRVGTLGDAKAAKSDTVQPFIPVLMYHHFAEGESSSLTVDPYRFREQLYYLKSLGYESITDEDLILHLQGKKLLPSRPLMITIDDGYLSSYEYAFPILKELDMKATLFVIVRSREEQRGFTPHFSWDQAREMVESGLISIQSHTYDSHRRIGSVNGLRPMLVDRKIKNGKQETQKEYRQRVKEDLLRSKSMIEQELDKEVYSLAYPFGAFTEEVEDIAREAGYQITYTVRPGVYYFGDRPFKINRINVPGDASGRDIESMIQRFAHQEDHQSHIYLVVNQSVVVPDQPPFVRNQRTYVPVRFVVQHLNANMEWDPDKKTLFLEHGNKKIEMTVNQRTVKVNEKSYPTDAPVIIEGGRVFVPIRVISEHLGGKAEWDPNDLNNARKIKINLK